MEILLLLRHSLVTKLTVKTSELDNSKLRGVPCCFVSCFGSQAACPASVRQLLGLAGTLARNSLSLASSLMQFSSSTH